MPKIFDLTLLPLYRLHGREMPSPPGLLALTPPRRRVRSRARDRLIVQLTLSGNAPSSTANYMQMTARAAEQFYQTPGSLTSALRAAATTLNDDLLERNMSASGQGRYALGHLILGALRGEQFYFLECGPTHIIWMSNGETKHIHDPNLSGRGLGLSQSTEFYLSQITLQPGGRLLLSPKLPLSWEQTLQRDNRPAALEVIHRYLMAQTTEDLNATLIEALPGKGLITVVEPERPKKPALSAVPAAEDGGLSNSRSKPAPSVKLYEPPTLKEEPEPPKETIEPAPSAYAIPPKQERATPRIDLDGRSFPSSIPRATPVADPIPDEEPFFDQTEEIEEEYEPAGPPVGKVVAQQTARTLAGGMQAARQTNKKLSEGFRTMMPRLLPGSDSEKPVSLPNWLMALIAVIIPLLVVTIASVVYFHFGPNMQYEGLLAEAEAARARAIGQPDPIAERIAWEDALIQLNKADDIRITDQSRALRQEAQNHLDTLLGIVRLSFQPAVSDLPRGAQITRMAATETELFMLDASEGQILRAFLTSTGYQFDETFICKPDSYGEHHVGELIELQTLPKANALGASVMGIDSSGNLLYCAANQVPQAVPLQPPSIPWREITAITLDADVLYVLDAPEVWVYSGQAGAFINHSTSFFSGQAPNDLINAIDLAVNGSDLYLLFADGHLATCVYSLLDTVPTRCTDPAQLSDPHPAAGGGDTFGQAHFSQILLTTPPDSAIFLLDADAQAVFRFSPRSLELQNQLHTLANNSENPFPSGSLTAMTANPSHVLFLAQGEQVYLALDVP